MSVSTCNIRQATAADAEVVADVFLESRRTFVPFAPLAHTDEEVREWIAWRLIPSGGVMVAEEQDGVVTGMAAVSQGEECGWIEHLYMRPGYTGVGVGTRLLREAMGKLRAPVRLYTFQANAGARRFYERHGFRAVAFGDGSGNEEGCPDVLYEWSGELG